MMFRARSAARSALWLTLAAVASGAGALAATWSGATPGRPVAPDASRAPGAAGSAADRASTVDWLDVRGDRGGMRHSPLTQITRENVTQLQVAWTYHTGDAAPARRSTIECTPIVIDGVMYVTTVTTKVVALDAATGREKWTYDPHSRAPAGTGGDPDALPASAAANTPPKTPVTPGPTGATRPGAAGGVNRGVAFWRDPRDASRTRIFLGTADGRLISLDTATGRPDPAFGANGTLDLRLGMEDDPDAAGSAHAVSTASATRAAASPRVTGDTAATGKPAANGGLADVTRGARTAARDLSQLAYGMTSPATVFEDFVIVGLAVDEGPRGAASGDIRAFDARTGRERWRFHTVPRPGEPGHETWTGTSWRHRGGVNAWSGLTLDERRGLVFAGLGSATFDFYGGDRHGDNLFANSVVALDARTGTRRWHYQAVRHDMWDMDLPTPPALVTVTHDGRRIDAAAQLTKTGFVYLLDRETGKPLFPMDDRPVPASEIPGERAARTQPVPVKPPALVRQTFTERDLSTRTPAVARELRERFRSLKPGALFTPLSLVETVTVPGLLGGANWSGGSFDPATGLLYVNVNDLPYVLALEQMPAAEGYPYRVKGYTHFRDSEGYPAIAPPWGSLVAVNLNAGTIEWRQTLGVYPALVAKGLPPTGTENIGGTIVTAGGLVFVGSTKDERFRAFDARSGAVLWEQTLEAGGYAAPATYAVNGRQFVAIAAGGGGKMQTKSGDAFVAFALPSMKP